MQFYRLWLCLGSCSWYWKHLAAFFIRLTDWDSLMSLDCRASDGSLSSSSASVISLSFLTKAIELNLASSPSYTYIFHLEFTSHLYVQLWGDCQVQYPLSKQHLLLWKMRPPTICPRLDRSFSNICLLQMLPNWALLSSLVTDYTDGYNLSRKADLNSFDVKCLCMWLLGETHGQQFMTEKYQSSFHQSMNTLVYI